MATDNKQVSAMIEALSSPQKSLPAVAHDDRNKSRCRGKVGLVALPDTQQATAASVTWSPTRMMSTLVLITVLNSTDPKRLLVGTGAICVISRFANWKTRPRLLSNTIGAGDQACT